MVGEGSRLKECVVEVLVIPILSHDISWIKDMVEEGSRLTGCVVLY